MLQCFVVFHMGKFFFFDGGRGRLFYFCFSCFVDLYKFNVYNTVFQLLYTLPGARHQKLSFYLLPRS